MSSSTETPLGSEQDEGGKDAPNRSFLLTPVFWQNVLAGMIGTVSLSILGAVAALFYTFATGTTAPTVIRVLLSFAAAGTLVIAISATVQLCRTKEKHGGVIMAGSWFIFAATAVVAAMSFAATGV